MVNSAEATEYTIEIPSQGTNTFSSFLLYVVERDKPVMVTNVVVSSGTPAEPEPVAGVVADFTTGSFDGSIVDAETETYTFPTGAPDYVGFANNADI